MEAPALYSAIPGDLVAALSLVLLTLAGLAVVVWDAFRARAAGIPWLTAGVFGAAIVWELFHLTAPADVAFFGMIRTGGYAAFVNVIILVSGLFTTILAGPYLRHVRHDYGEVYALLLFASVGMILLGTANNLVSVFVGLETMSIALYIMTGLVRSDEGSAEAALKYFLLGAFSTGFFLYGIALIYGATGTMYLPLMASGLAATGSFMLFWTGIALLLIGFFFKVSAAPFHMWTPDVYQGAPTPLTGYMSTASKASAFAALTLVLYFVLPAELALLPAATPLGEAVVAIDLPSGDWRLVLAVVAVATMVIGNALALAQDNVKRMLAYSSIAHAGYVLVGLAAGTSEGYAGALLYLLVYAIMNLGAFGVLALLEWDEHIGRLQTVQSLAGSGQRHPVLGVGMVIFMLSLLGFPPLAGFFGKVAVFAPAIDAGLTWLVIIGVLASAVSAAYYLRVLWVMFMKTSEDYPEAEAALRNPRPIPALSQAVIVACAVLLLVLGLLPTLYELTASYFPGAAPLALGG